jgi:drug/metabolite transporter (DMT)-like permease
VNFTLLDSLLLLMVFIWGSNFSIVKVALRDFPEIAFNAMRMAVGSAVFLSAIQLTRQDGAPRPALTRRDWTQLALLGMVGTFLYQLCFVAGVGRTSVANSSLIIGISPVIITVMSAIAGHERIKAMRWAGVVLALFGLCVVLARGLDLSGATWRGDALMIAAVTCWSLFTVASQPILKRHSPLMVIGLAFSIGGLLYVVATLPILIATHWRSVSAFSWVMMLISALFSLNLSYWIWYTGLKKLGGSRTSVYSYLTPIVAIAVAAIWLGEPISTNQIAGAGAIFAGLLITRFVN